MIRTPGVPLKPPVVLCVCLLAAAAFAERETVTFESGDGLTLTADLYLAQKSPRAPFLVLCHQARWSRGEYLRIAPWLNELGYNCLAVDLRAGKTILGVPNETAQRARQHGLKPDCCEAEPDIVAALRFARGRYAKGKLILVGSSSSASLALRVAAQHPELVDGVAAFSPGEYFTSEGKCSDWTERSAGNIDTGPVFISWAGREDETWRPIAEAVETDRLTLFAPRRGGQHGARALWSETKSSDLYRTAFRRFLAAHFPPAKD